jgi:hypothetical protein
MVGRRNMLGSGLLAGLTGAFGSSAAAEAAPMAAEDTSAAAAAAIDQLRTTVERQSSPGTVARAIGQIRQQQRVFLRANQKYPDYMEVGLSVWEDVYDWHVRYQQPINAARLPDGRYVLSFMFTNLILRPDQAFEFVGFGFDNDGRRTP